MTVSRLNTEKKLRDAMGSASAAMVFGLELFLWDVVLMPLLLAGAAKSSLECRRVLTAMRCDLSPNNK